MEFIKVITVWQPWASLLAHGIKEYETRSWKTNHRGKILIHSAKRWEVDQIQFHEAHSRMLLGKDVVLPKGKILAQADLVDCIEMDNLFIRGLTKTEQLFGDFRVGRYAWKMANVELLETPLRWSGMQGMWQIEEEKFMEKVNFGGIEW